MIDLIESGGADLLSYFDKVVDDDFCLVIAIGGLSSNDADVSISSVKYGENLDQNYSTKYVAALNDDNQFVIYMLLCKSYMKKVKLTEEQNGDLGTFYAETDEIDVSQRNVIIVEMKQN